MLYSFLSLTQVLLYKRYDLSYAISGPVGLLAEELFSARLGGNRKV